MNLINLTPHPITLRGPDGAETVIPPSGTVARVATTPGKEIEYHGVFCPVYSAPITGAVTGLPPAAPDTLLIVSGVVADAVGGSRNDVVRPGTGPADGAIRDGEGRITAVTRLVRSH